MQGKAVFYYPWRGWSPAGPRCAVGSRGVSPAFFLPSLLLTANFEELNNLSSLPKISVLDPLLEAAQPVLDGVLQSLENSKAEDVVSIPIAHKSSLGAYFVIASGRSQRHVGWMADQLLHDLKTQGIKKPRIEGVPQCDWVVVDAGEVLVHIFRPEVRAYYKLEKLWGEESNAEFCLSPTGL